MPRAAIIKKLRRHRAELEAEGMTRLSMFGSTARGEAGSASDVDLAATFADGARMAKSKDFADNYLLEEEA